MQRVLGLVCLTLLAGAATADERFDVLVGPHFSSRDRVDSAGELQTMMQLKINTLGEEATGQPELKDYIESHNVLLWGTNTAPVVAVLEGDWSANERALVLIAGQYQQDQDTFISTFFVGTATADFAVRSATVNILATPEFRTADDLATLLLHYAMVRDARSANRGREIIIPIASRALEIVASVKPSLSDRASKATVTAIEADLTKLVDQLRIQP